jgi:hypothetical protein
MEIIATIQQILPLVTGQGKNGEWRKQEIIIETGDQYPKKVCLSIWGDKINESVLKIGATLKFSLEIESREYNGRWYTDVKAWKYETAGGTNYNAPKNQQNVITPDPDFLKEDDGDGLPF